MLQLKLIILEIKVVRKQQFIMLQKTLFPEIAADTETPLFRISKKFISRGGHNCNTLSHTNVTLCSGQIKKIVSKVHFFIRQAECCREERNGSLCPKLVYKNRDRAFSLFPQFDGIPQ